MEQLEYYPNAHHQQRYIVVALLPLGVSIFAFIAAVIWSYYCLSFVPAGTVVRPLNLVGDVFVITMAAAATAVVCGAFAIWKNRKHVWLRALAILGILCSLAFVPLSLLAIRLIIDIRGLIDLG